LSTTTSDLAASQDRVWLALRFGWTLAEVYGRLAENPPPDTPSSSTRLFLGDLNPTPNERLWAATQRLIYLVNQLFPPKKEKKGQGEQALADSGPDSVALPECIGNLLQSLEQRMPGEGKLPRAASLYDDLNQWSRQIWATLDAEDPLLAEAATLGARLTDTFWLWRFPSSGQLASPEQSWQHLLNPKRIIRLIRRVRLVEAHLPAHVGPMLRHSLWEWNITGELARSRSGELVVAHSLLHGLRSLRWAQVLRRRLRKARRKDPPQLDVVEERTLWKRLRNQVFTWEHLVFNRPLTQLLRPSDWRQVRWVTIFLYAIAVILITAGGGWFFARLIQLVSQLLIHLLPFLAAPTEFKDQLTLASTLVVILAFLVTQFRRGLGRLRHLYDAIYNWVMMRKLEQRGLRAWNGQTKPLRWIWVQRLLRAED
jgi:hypothetical protein